uniref:Fringe n=1 Tax=Acrobeloides nanus TaxID=290746 RepID=A0A914CQL1_9BILA
MLLFSIFVLFICHQSLARFIAPNRKVPVEIHPGELTITVKTTRKFHNTRVKDILDTWFRLSPENIFFISDTNDQALNQSTNGHLINSKCPSSHNSRALCCKMNHELDFFVQRDTKWSCHFDDDNYVNVDELIKTLRQFDPNEDWYLGRPSTNGPIKIDDSEAKSEFWFATGGAGLCLSRSVIHKLATYVKNHGFKHLGHRIQSPDDVTLGYLLEHLLNIRLTIIDKFHSHFELLDGISEKKLHSQISLSAGSYDEHRENYVKVPILFSHDQDPQRILNFIMIY